MEKKNYFLFIVMTILCLACVDESSLSDSELAAFTAGENVDGDRLLSLMCGQKGSYERFSKLILSDEKPLFTSAVLMVSGRYGLHYSVPYVDEHGMVAGCVLYPLDESFPHEQQMPLGKLGIPIRIDVQVLNEQIPIMERYLYSVPFDRWEKGGLKVDGRLTEFARLLDKGSQSVKADMAERTKTRGSMDVFPGGYMSLDLYYNYTPYTYVVGGKLVTVTLDLEKMVEKIKNLFRPSYQEPLYWWYINDATVRAYSERTMMDVGFIDPGTSFCDCEEKLRDTFNRLAEDYDYSRLHILFSYTYTLYLRNGTTGAGSSSGDFQIGGAGGGTSLPSPDLSLINLIIRDVSGLNEIQQGLLHKAIEEAQNSNCYIDKILSYLSSVDFKFDSAIIDQSMEGEAGTTLSKDLMGNIIRKLNFRSNEFIQASSFSHELIHLFQTEQGMYKDNSVRGMMEYERVLMDDILFYAKVKGEGGKITYEEWNKKLDHTLIYGGDSKALDKYKCWLRNITQNGIPDSISNEDLKRWIPFWNNNSIPYSANRGYRYDVEYVPKALNKLLELSKKCFK